MATQTSPLDQPTEKKKALRNRESYELAFGLSLLSFPEEAVEAAEHLNPLHIQNQNISSLYKKMLTGEPYVEETAHLKMQSSDVLLNTETRRYRPRELAKKLYDFWMREMYASRMEGILQDARAVTIDLTFQRTQAILSELSSAIQEEKPADAISIWDRMIERSKEFGELSGKNFKTGVTSLDKIATGLFPGHIWVIGGDTGSGKTTFTLWLANKLLHQGKKLVYFSLENGQEDIVARLASINLNIPFVAIKTGNLSEEEVAEVKKFRKHLEQLPLFVYDTLFDVFKISQKAKYHRMREECEVIVIDYIQNVDAGGGNDGMYDTMRAVAHSLQKTALELGIGIIIVSQLSQFERRTEGEKKRSMKGAGDILEVADVGMWIEQTKDHRLDVFLNKVRHGTANKCAFRFYDPHAGDYIEELP